MGGTPCTHRRPPGDLGKTSRHWYRIIILRIAAVFETIMQQVVIVGEAMRWGMRTVLVRRHVWMGLGLGLGLGRAPLLFVL